MKRHCRILILCLSIVFCMISGCSQNSGTKHVQLTEEQEAQIDIIVQHRDEWGETQTYSTNYYVNRMHIYESDSGYVVLSAAYVKDGTGMMEGTQIFVGEQGYAVIDDQFVPLDVVYDGWLAASVSVDPENMTDEELREVVKQAYISYLSSK